MRYTTNLNCFFSRISEPSTVWSMFSGSVPPEPRGSMWATWAGQLHTLKPKKSVPTNN